MGKLRIISIGACISACALASAVAADNTPLKVKPGLWEITSETRNSGMPPIPPEALAHITPQQRAQLEAGMKDTMAKQAEPRVRKSCVTQQDIDKGFENINQANKGQCTRTETASSPTLHEGRVVCTGASKTSGSYHFEARNPESITGNWDLTMSDGTHTMDMKSKLQGKWLGADCGSIKSD
jgi:hypothetical protein